MQRFKMGLTIIGWLIAQLAWGTIILVPTDQPTIHDGIYATVSGDTVLIEPGVYYERIGTSDRIITIGSRFLLTGDQTYIYETILDANHEGAAVFLAGVGTACTFVGFTIRNGFSDLNCGGGITAIESEGGYTTLSHMLIHHNTGGWAGGIYKDSGHLYVSNCTIADNTAFAPGYISGGINCSPIDIVIENSILWGNLPQQTSFDPGIADISCTDMQDGLSGDTNFDANPVFCNPVNENFHLHADSPCLPGNHPDGADCELIGALGQGCEGVDRIGFRFDPAVNPELLTDLDCFGDFWYYDFIDYFDVSVWDVGFGYAEDFGIDPETGYLSFTVWVEYTGHPNTPITVDLWNDFFNNFCITRAHWCPSIRWTAATGPEGAGNIWADMDQVIMDSWCDFTEVGNFNFTLSQNYPNPFNPTTEIPYTLAEPVNVTLTVYDVLGRKVAALVDGFQPVGQHEVTFDGSGLASGVYYYQLLTDDQRLTRKMLLVR